MGRLILVYDHPESGEQRVEIEDDRSYRIGAQPDNDIVIASNDISRHHAILRMRQGTPHITDLNSKNGTFINGRRTASSTFRVGDTLYLSSIRFSIEEEGSEDHVVESTGSGADRVGDADAPATEDTLPLTFDANLGLEYRYSKLLSFWARFNNLAAQRYYLYNNYPSYRFRVMLGLTYAL